jgi:hypothetical protein
MKPPVPTKRATVILVKVKSRNGLLSVVLVLISIYLTSVLRHEFLILVTYLPDSLMQREQGCEDPWLFLEAKRVLRTNRFGKHWPRRCKTFYYSVLTGKPFLLSRMSDRGNYRKESVVMCDPWSLLMVEKYFCRYCSFDLFL